MAMGVASAPCQSPLRSKGSPLTGRPQCYRKVTCPQSSMFVSCWINARRLTAGTGSGLVDMHQCNPCPVTHLGPDRPEAPAQCHG